MRAVDDVPALVGAMDRVGQTRLGRELAVRLDLVRSVSAGHAWRRYRATGKSARRRPAGELEPVYKAIWRDAADTLGAELRELPGGFVELGLGDTWTRVWRHWVMLDDAVTLRFALQKALVQQRLAEHGLPVPEHVEFPAADLSPALEFLQRGPVPCVLKPVGDSGGSGVTSGVRTLANLMRARLRAWRIDERLLLERQIAGENYRLLFLDGELLDVVRRGAPKVTGDGRSSIEELIEAENARRAAREEQALFWRLDIDLDCLFTLEALGLTPASVPAQGETLAVKTVVNQNTAEDNETVREQLSEELIAQARAAAEVVGVRLAGVDLITRDLTRPLSESGGAIIEVNGTPGLSYHYDVLDRAHATRVAVPILRALLGVSAAVAGGASG
jgi:cyanophycin synthetase